MRHIEIIVAPFHAGAHCCRVGKGPHRLLDAGLIDTLCATGAAAEVVEITPVDAFEGEIGRSFEVKRRVATAVSAALAAGRFPLVLAGNCNASVGTYAGLGDPEVGVVWFDAHADFDTPDERLSGYFDGMGVATLAGQCWRRLSATIPGYRPIELSRFVYCGIRDFEPGQREKVEAYGLRAVHGSTDAPVDFVGSLDAILAGFAAERVLVHLDLDCLDISVGRANEYAAPGGLSAAHLVGCMERLAAHTTPAAMTIASFNPDLEGSDAIAAAGVRAAEVIVRALGSRP
jgi:arginase